MLALVAACGPTSTPDKPAPAPAPAAPPDLNAQVIELKNLLQKEPYSAEARLALGLAWLDLANPRAAEAELARAVELGLDPNRGLPPLARAWNMLGRSKELIATHGAATLTRPDAAAELMAELALAQARVGNAKGARELTTRALQADPSSAAARLVQAQVDLSDGKVDEAMKVIELVLAGKDRIAQAWELKGDVLLLVKRDAAAGRAAYESALQASPRSVPVRAKLVAAALDRDDLAEAQSQLAALERIAPGSPPVYFLTARLALLRGDIPTARASIQRALAEYPKDLRNLILGAEIELRGGSLVAASEHLANALTLAPRLPRVRHLLAQTFLRSGAPDKAEMILDPLLRSKAPDAETLGLAAEAALQAGLSTKAARLFERAAAIQPDNPRFRTAAALGRVSRGDLAGGIAELEAVSAAHPSTYADMALLSTRVQQGDQRGAVKAAEKLAVKQPRSALPHLLLGRLALQARDPGTARRHLQKAVDLDPAFVPAALALANLDIQQGAVAEARKRFERVLQHAPNNLEALVALADVQHRTGEAAAVVAATLESAIRLHPGQARPRIALIQHYILTGQGKEALATAQAASGQFPEDLVVMDALGRAQVAAGEPAQALTTFKRIASLRPRAYEPLLRMADVYVSRNEIDSAIESYKQALLISPDLMMARIRLVGLHTVKKDWREAMYGAKLVQTRLPKDPAGHHLEGLVHAAQQQWPAAIASFRSALKVGPVAEVAIQLHGALTKSGRGAEAGRFAADWLAAHPGDLQFRGHLGEMAVAMRDYAGAEQHFRAIVDRESRNVRALNNLAWVLVRQGKPGAAELARRALQAEPANVNIMDTLASAMSAEGRHAEALTVQKRAVDLAPDVPMLRLTLARIAVSTKDYPLARANLDQLSALGKDFPAQSAVWELRQQLR